MKNASLGRIFRARRHPPLSPPTLANTNTKNTSLGRVFRVRVAHDDEHLKRAHMGTFFVLVVILTHPAHPLWPRLTRPHPQLLNTPLTLNNPPLMFDGSPSTPTLETRLCVAFRVFAGSPPLLPPTRKTRRCVAFFVLGSSSLPPLTPPSTSMPKLRRQTTIMYSVLAGYSPPNLLPSLPSLFLLI